MDIIHNAIAWYQKKIGSYDKQLWEQSVERKLQKSPPYVHNTPKKSVRLKTEYIDVDLIRGSTFSKTKPQVPWVYITRKAIARVVFFPFYYKWWVLQTSRKLYIMLLGLYCLQILTMVVYIWDFDDSITEDEVSLTAVVLPLIIMFLLCLVHSQTVLAHINHKPPKRTKRILELVRKSKQKKTTRKSHRSSGNNSSVCPEDNVPSDSSKQDKDQSDLIPSTFIDPSRCSQTPNQLSDTNSAQHLSSGNDKKKSAKSHVRCKMPPDSSDQQEITCELCGTKDDLCACSCRDNIKEYSFSKSTEENVIRRRTNFSPQEDSHLLKCDLKAATKVGHISVVSSYENAVPHSSASSVLSSSLSPPQETEMGNCSFDLLDNLPEMRPKEKVYRDFCSQTDNATQTRVGLELDSGQNISVSGNASSLSISEQSMFDLSDVDEKVKNQPRGHTVKPSLIRETSGESAISGHSDLHSSSEFEVVEHMTNQPGACSSHKSSYVTFSSSPVSENQCYATINAHHRSVHSHKGQSSPDSGISCQPCLHRPKTAVDNSHPLNGEGFCRHCSLDTSAHIIQNRSDPPGMAVTNTDLNDFVERRKTPSELKSICGNKSLCSHHDSSLHEPHMALKNHPHFHSSENDSYPSLEQTHDNSTLSKLMPDSSGLQCFSEQLVQGILNVDTLREVSSSSLLANSAPDNSSSLSDRSQLSITSTSSSSSLSASLDSAMPDTAEQAPEPTCPNWQAKGIMSSTSSEASNLPISERRQFSGKVLIHGQENQKSKILSALDESLEQIVSDVERTSDGSNYNPSDSEADSDTAATARLRNKCEEKRFKRLRFQDVSSSSGGVSPNKGNSSKLSASKGSTNIGGSPNSNSQRSSLVDLRKPLPLKDLTLGRKSTPTSQIHSSGSDVCQSDARTSVRRRRRTSGNQADTGDVSRSRSLPTSLGLHPQEKHKPASSSENETGGAHTPEGSNKAAISSEEWEDRIQSDDSTSSTYSSTTVNTDSEVHEYGEDGEEDRTEYPMSTMHVINLLQPPFSPVSLQPSGSSPTSGNITQPDKVSSVIWEGNECKKVNLTALDIGWAIIDKVDSLPESSDYFLIGVLFSFIMALIPVMFRLYINKDLVCLSDLLTWSGLLSKVTILLEGSQRFTWRQSLLMFNGIIQRFVLSLLFFFLLCVADRTFKQRLLYAKHFSYLTSSRRARKFSMPHFRLNKVRNIKIWLSLRSYLKRRGPQRSVDVIVSASFLCIIIIVSLISLQVLKDADTYLDFLCNWELSIWFLALGVFLMRFMTLGLKINKKYRNLSVLITEQINLYLQMEQKPHKKEELILANNVLRLAEDLLKELESPFKISGFSLNPLIYNITKVIVLSAFSAVLTEVLGFKLKLHKIKLLKG